MTITVILETARLKLRCWRMTDAPALARLYADDSIMRYMRPGKGLPRAEAESRAKANIVNFTQQGRDKTYSIWAVEERNEGRLVGQCGLNWIDAIQSVEVSYLLNKTTWGRGYGSELAAAAVDFGFRQVGLAKIVGLTHPDNKASQRILIKSGLSYRRTSKDLWNTTLAWFDADQTEWLLRFPTLAARSSAATSQQSP